MSYCLTAEERAELEAELATLKAEKLEAYTTLRETNKAIFKYRFDSVEASQEAQRRKVEEITRLIEWLSSQIKEIQERLSCVPGVITMRLRRL